LPSGRPHVWYLTIDMGESSSAFATPAACPAIAACADGGSSSVAGSERNVVEASRSSGNHDPVLSARDTMLCIRPWYGFLQLQACRKGLRFETLRKSARSYGLSSPVTATPAAKPDTRRVVAEGSASGRCGGGTSGASSSVECDGSAMSPSARPETAQRGGGLLAIYKYDYSRSSVYSTVIVCACARCAAPTSRLVVDPLLHKPQQGPALADTKPSC